MAVLPNITHRMPPYDHQDRILAEHWDSEWWALFLEMGTGKSAILIEMWACQFLAGLIDAVLVVAKKGEYDNWPEHLIPDHMPIECPYSVIVFDAKTWDTVAMREERKAFIGGPRRLRILVMNIEAVDTDQGWTAIQKFYAAFPGKVAWTGDESTWMKNVKNESTRGKAAKKDIRAKRMLKLRDQSPFRRIAAGLPNPNSPLDMWGQALMLKPGLLGYDDWYSFRNYYAIVKRQYMGPNRPSFDKITGWNEERLKELQKLIRTFADVMTLDECTDIPLPVYDKKAIRMTPEQEQLYADMRDKAMISVRDTNGIITEIVATNVLSQLGRLHQIVCGQLKTGPDKYVSIPNNRLTSLGEIFEDHQGKAIAWAGYRQTGEDAHKHLVKLFGPNAVARYYGDTEGDERRAIIENFQNLNHPLRFIVASRSMAYSFTLTAGDLNVYYSNTSNLEHRLQSERRTRRIGQKKHVHYIDFYVPGTIDEHIMDLLREHKHLSHEVLGTPITRWI